MPNPGPQQSDGSMSPVGRLPLRHRLRRPTVGVRHPEGFHGRPGRRPFFEGWYVKAVSADLSERLAVIPGLFVGDDGASEAFVQVLDGTRGTATYHRFPAEEFHASADRFDVRVGNNRFTHAGMSVDLPDIRGEIRFASPLHPWPVTWRSPGIMGWYGWLPTMECYHGLLSFDHALAGTVELAGRIIDLDGGRGYVEKDWGQAFPSAYVWMQTNSFSTPGVSLSASIAIIPWRRSAFRGFIVGLWRAGRLTPFATYTGATATSLEIDDVEVRWTLRSRGGRTLELQADRPDGGLLHAPIRTEMHRRVEETLDATVSVTLRDPSGRVEFRDTGRCAGLEVHGDLERLAALG